MKSIRNHNQNFPALRKINCWHFASAAPPRDLAWAQPAVFDQPKIAPTAAHSQCPSFCQNKSHLTCCGSYSPCLPPFCRYSRYEGMFRWFEHLVLPAIVNKPHRLFLSYQITFILIKIGYILSKSTKIQFKIWYNLTLYVMLKNLPDASDCHPNSLYQSHAYWSATIA